MSPDGGHGRKGGATASLATLLSRLIKGVEWLEKRRRTDGKMLEDLRWLAYVVERAVKNHKGRAPLRPGAPVDKALQGPAPTVQDIDYQALGNGRVLVTFDHAEQVTLTRSLKELLAVLAADVGESPDDLVAWKNFAQLPASLEKRLDRKVTPRAVAQLLWRLRQSFGAESRGRGLIESNPKLGVRLRLTRKPSPALAGG